MRNTSSPKSGQILKINKSENNININKQEQKIKIDPAELEKLKLLEFDIKDDKKFKEKILDFFLTEFEEKIDNILILEEREFIENFNSRMKLIFEDFYSSEVFNNYEFRNLYREISIYFYDGIYKKNYEFLVESWENLELWEESGVHSQNKNGRVTTIQDEKNYLTQFRKHCTKSELEYALHTCGGKFVMIYNNQNGSNNYAGNQTDNMNMKLLNNKNKSDLNNNYNNNYKNENSENPTSSMSLNNNSTKSDLEKREIKKLIEKFDNKKVKLEKIANIIFNNLYVD